MEFTRQELTELLFDMQHILSDLEKLGMDKTSTNYVRYWRQTMRLEEKLYRHPY